MKRYDSYKDSGVEWIGDIPINWTFVKLGYLGSLKSGNGFSETLQGRDVGGDYPFFKVSDTNNFGNEELMTSSNNYVTEEEYSNNKWNLFDKNTIVFPKIGMVLLMNKRRILGQPSFIDNNMMGFTPNKKIHYQFSYYLFKMIDFKDYCSDGTIPSIGGSQISPIKIPLPPLSEQQQIVSFLDSKTSLIDSLIEKTQQKIELLKEKRTSLINEVVTKGLNPNVEMKDSGVEWIGEIPCSWIESQFKYYIKLRHGHQFRDGDFTDEGVKIIKITQLDKGGFLNLSNCSTIDKERLTDFEDILIYENDILMCLTGGTIGKIIKVGKVDEPLLQNYRVGHFSPIDSQSMGNNYMFYLMSSEVIVGQIFYDVRETGQPNIGMEDMNRMRICIPPISEQQQIVEYLDEQTQLIDKTISIEKKRIELLKEYRQSLISEVVTGKRKVV